MTESADTASVSVVVVTMGGSRLLERGLDALAAGSIRPLEVVLVDQSGAGACVGLDERLDRARIQLHRLAIEPMGVSRARNLGAAAARGEYLAFTDDDCVPATDWLEKLLAAASAAQAQAATGRVLALNEGIPGAVAVSLRTDPRAAVYRPGEEAYPWDVGTGGNLLIERRRFGELGGFDEALGPGAPFRAAEDVELIERLLTGGAVVAYEPGAVVYHEMKPLRQVLRRSYPYGYGMGAVVAKADVGRRGALARRYAAIQLRESLAALRRGSLPGVLEGPIACFGLIAGALAMRWRRDAD